jgi:hypothetical protein
MYTIFSAVLRQQRKNDVMTYFGHTAHSAVYYQAGSPFLLAFILLFVYLQTFPHMNPRGPCVGTSYSAT